MNIFNKILILSCSLLLLVSCNEERLYLDEGSESPLTITLQMPSSEDSSNGQSETSPRRIGLSPVVGSKNLYPEWAETDKVQVILRRGNEIYNLGRARVTNISANKRTATVNFDRRETPNVSPPYTLYLFAGNDNLASADAIGGGAWSAYCRYELQRAVGGYFHAPMFCQLEVKSDGVIPVAQFQHFGTYELLHVFNATNRPITFGHQGFDVKEPWYQASTTVWFYDEYDLSPHGEWDGDAESQIMTIMPGSENIIYSWYIPSGYPISNASLIANINGKFGVKSSNTFSSTVLPQRGYAYHMYASWDGEQLRIDPPSAIRLSLSSYELTVQKGYGGTVHILKGSGSYSVGSSNASVAGATLSRQTDGSTNINISAINAGKTVVTVSDQTTSFSAQINITVTEDALPYAEGSYADLGLPSGTLWATCNVGASVPEEAGWYVSWGELTEKSYYSTSNYYMFKAGNTSDLNNTQDVAMMVLGTKWRMPSYEQLAELLSCSWSWEKKNGVQGARVTGPSGQSIFLPAATFKESSGTPASGTYGSYWGRTHGNPSLSTPCGAELVFGTADYKIGFNASDFYFEMGPTGYCHCGRSVRPIYIGLK